MCEGQIMKYKLNHHSILKNIFNEVVLMWITWGLNPPSEPDYTEFE